MISDEDIERVSAATDFVALVAETTPVKQRGRDFWCCCPFHKEKTASCKIDPSTNMWHCFGCGEGGTVFNYVMKLHDVSFPEAVQMLADRAHIEIENSGGSGTSNSEKKRLKECCRAACDFYAEQLLKGRNAGANNARKYLASRKFNIDVAKRWHLGFAAGSGVLTKHLTELGFTTEEMVNANLCVSKNGRVNDRFYERVMFPIFDIHGDCVAFGGRVMGKGEPKYLNSSETKIFHKSNVLFGLDQAKNEIVTTGYAVVVEGYTDVIAMHENGIKNVVATLGTALTMQHIKLLSRYASSKIVYLFDGDEAGQRAAERALQFIDYSMTPEAGQSRCDLHAATIPNNEDPAEYLESHGAAAMREILENSGSLIDFGINRKLSRYNLSTPEGRSRALIDAVSILAPIKESILAQEYAQQIASSLGLSENIGLQQLSKLKAPNKREYSAPREPVTPEPQPVATPKPAAAESATTVDANRIRNEREVVSIACQYPQLAVASGDELFGINWQQPTNRVIVESVLSNLSNDLNMNSNTLITKITQENPAAGNIVSSALVADESEARSHFSIALTNLILDDLNIRQMNLQMQIVQAKDKDKREELLREVEQIGQEAAAIREKLNKR